MTRMPFWSDSATFSAASRQMEQRRKSASPSFHSCVWRSKMRGVDAIVNDATATPDAVKRNSGSATRFPTTQMTVSPAIRLVPSSRCVRQPSRLGRCRGRSAIRRRRRGGRGPLRLRRGCWGWSRVDLHGVDGGEADDAGFCGGDAEGEGDPPDAPLECDDVADGAVGEADEVTALDAVGGGGGEGGHGGHLLLSCVYP